MLSNPLIFRGVRSSTRPGQLTVLGVVLLVLLLSSWLFLSDAGTRGEQVLAVWGGFVLVIQYVAALLFAPAAIMNAMPNERSERSEEFFITLPISGPRKVVGLLIGRSISPILVMLVLTPFACLALLGGRYSIGQVLWTQLLLWVSWASVGLMSVLIGQGLGSNRIAWLLILLLLIFGAGTTSLAYDKSLPSPALLTLSPAAINAAVLGDADALAACLQPGAYRFFGVQVRWQLVPLAFYALLGVTSFIAAARRMSRPSSPPTPRLLRLGFVILLHLLLIGSFSQAFERIHEQWLQSGPRNIEISPFHTAVAYLLTFHIFGFLGGLFDLPEQDRQVEWVGPRNDWPTQLISHSFFDVRIPALLPLLAEWMVAVGAIWLVDTLYWDGAVGGPVIGLMALSWGLFLVGYLSIIWVGVLLSRKQGKLLGLLIVAGLFLLPLIFSAVGDAGLVAVTSLGPVKAADPSTSYLESPENWWISSIVSGGLISVVGLSLSLGVLSGLRRKSPSYRNARPSDV